jgi:hypothetical protein
MLGSHKVKLQGELLDQVRTCVKAGGYESIDQFVMRVLEREIQKILRPGGEEPQSRELIRKRLRGLGYIE